MNFSRTGWRLSTGPKSKGLKPAISQVSNSNMIMPVLKWGEGPDKAMKLGRDRDFKIMLKAMLAACFTSIVTHPSMAQSKSWYSFRSKCNFELIRKDGSAIAITNGKPCNATIAPLKYAPNVFSVSCGTRPLFSYMMDEGKLLILNDKYQHGCEAAKGILMDATDDADGPEAFRDYIADHDYILDDSAAILNKARFMNGRNRFGYSEILLKAFVAKYPESAAAYLLLADTSMGRNDPADAQKYYGLYRRKWSAQHNGAQAPVLRKF